MLPPDIESRILSYLHLEFGERPEDENALKLSELKYIGEYLLDGTPSHFWEFPCMGSSGWVIAQPWGDDYAIGTYSSAPYSLKKV